jgi:hypothetical protein
MPLVTEGQAQERKRKLWPVWLALGLVLLFLAVALIVPAVKPVECWIAGHRFRVEAGEVGRSWPHPSPGFQHERGVLNLPIDWWSLRVGRYYYRIWCQFPGGYLPRAQDP